MTEEQCVTRKDVTTYRKLAKITAQALAKNGFKTYLSESWLMNEPSNITFSVSVYVDIENIEHYHKVVDKIAQCSLGVPKYDKRVNYSGDIVLEYEQRLPEKTYNPLLKLDVKITLNLPETQKLTILQETICKTMRCTEEKRNVDYVDTRYVCDKPNT
jgi:hypothetical protein